MNSDSTLTVENIHKKFGYRQILKGANLSLSSSQFTILLGKNGAGKSTLFKIICGFLSPSQGNIYIQGQATSKEPELLRRSVGLISHNSQLYQALTAQENLAFFGKLRSIKNLKEKIKEVLKQVGLKKFADSPVSTFSSGMLKRLSIARLILANPPITLLDEPLDGLDYESTQFFHHFLAQYRDNGGTILMITHQVEGSFSYCDQVAILHQGKIQYQTKRSETSYEALMKDYQSIITS